MMSDTPKYAYWFLSDAERERLEAQQREEKRCQEQQMIEEAQRRQNARLAVVKSQLNEKVQTLRQQIRNLHASFSEIQEPNAKIEGISELTATLSSLSDQISVVIWEEDAKKIQLELWKLSASIEKISEYRNLKSRLIQCLRETICDLQLRPGIRSNSEPLISVKELESRIHLLATMVTPEPCSLNALTVQQEWEKDLTRIRKQCQLFDAKERWSQIQATVDGWNRQLLTGENQRNFQLLQTALAALKAAISTEKETEAVAALMQSESAFTTLALRLQKDSQTLKEQCEKNVSIFKNLEAKWRSGFSEDEPHSASCSASQSASRSASSEAAFDEFKTRLEMELAQLKIRTENEKVEFFMQAAAQLERKMDTFFRMRERLERLESFFGRLTAQVAENQWKRFAPEAFQELVRKREVLLKQLKNHQCARFEESFGNLEALGDCELALILPKVQAWSGKKEKVQAKLNSECDFMISASSNEFVSRWAGEEMRTLAFQLDQLQNQLDSECSDPEAIESEICSWRFRFDQILAAVEKVQEKETQRQYLVQRFQEKFRELGFSLAPPQLEDPSNPASGIVLTASRAIEGRTVNVRFDQETKEPVLYSVDGFPMPQKLADGKHFRTCDEAQRQLEVLHKLLEKNGILMGKVQWEDQPPVDLARAAMELPDAASRSLSEEE